MHQDIKTKNSKNNYILIIKNYIFVFLGVIYFIYYFSPKYSYISNSIKETHKLGAIFLEYSNAIMAFLTVIGLIGVINRLLHKILSKIVYKTTNQVDNIFVKYLVSFIKVNKYFIGLYIFFRFLKLEPQYVAYVNKTFYLIFLLIFIYFFTSFLNVTFENFLIKKTRFRTLNRNLVSFIKKILIITTWIIGVITVLSNLGYNVTALITGAGIGGLAIALAAQKTLSNVFGAITVLLTKPFKLGDYVKINGQVGTIKEMGLSHLTMIDKEGYYVLIPNEKLISNNIENFTKRETRRTEIIIGVKYNTTIEKLKKAVEIIENILEDYKQKESISSYRVHFNEFGNFSLNINITYFSLLNDDYLEYVKQKEEINLKIKQKFEDNNIKIPFPTQELIISTNTSIKD